MSRWLHIGQVFFFHFLLTEAQSRSIKTLKQYPVIMTKQAWSIKELLHGHFATSCFTGQHNKSWVGKRGPSCPLGWPIRTQGSLHLSRSLKQPYNNDMLRFKYYYQSHNNKNRNHHQYHYCHPAGKEGGEGGGNNNS